MLNLKCRISNGRVRGFTLIELLVVVGIIFVGSIAGIGGFRQYVASKKLDTAAAEVESLLNNARINSVTQTLPPSTILCTDGGGYSQMRGYSVSITSITTYEMRVNCNGSFITINSKKYKLPDQVTFEVASDEISFRAASGNSTSASDKTIRIIGPYGSKQIKIDPAGNITTL